MDDRTVRALVTAAAWIAVVIAARWLLLFVYGRWERRRADRDPAAAARRRTTFSFLQRVLVALVAAIGVWSVLSIFPQTSEVARAILASSAVLAVFAGLALNTPLGNLGSGVLVAFTQPLRLGDRVTVGEQTGFVEQINLIYTELVTDDDRRIFVPNTQLTTTAIVNRTIKDPRRSVSALLPIRLGCDVAKARAVLEDAAAGTPGIGDVRITVGEITDRLVWLTVAGFAPLTADVVAIGSDLRERSLTALAAAELLPT
jgi:small conductance mechanosensitive channel